HGSVTHRSLDSFPTRRSSDLVTGGDGDRHLAAPLGDEGGDLLGSLAGDVLAEQGRAGQGATLELLRVGERAAGEEDGEHREDGQDRKSTRLNSSHVSISYAVF